MMENGQKQDSEVLSQEHSALRAVGGSLLADAKQKLVYLVASIAVLPVAVILEQKKLLSTTSLQLFLLVVGCLTMISSINYFASQAIFKLCAKNATRTKQNKKQH